MHTTRSLLLGGAIAFGLIMGYTAAPMIQGQSPIAAAMADDASVATAKTSLETALGKSLASSTPAEIAAAIASTGVSMEDAVIAADQAGVNMTSLIGALAANSAITNAELNTAIATAVGRGYDQTALVREATQYRSAYSYTSGTGGMSRSIGGALGGLGGTSSGGGGEGTIDCTRASPTDPLPEGC